MTFDLSVKPPRTVDGFLELVARAIFASGLSWQAIEPRWPEIREAFERFSVAKITAYEASDIDRVLAAPAMIRNLAKVSAVVTSATMLARLRDEHGSVRRWLDQMATFSERSAALRRFPYVGRWGAYYVLSVSGYDVPPYEEWQDSA